MIHAAELDAIPRERLAELGSLARREGELARPVLAAAPPLPPGMIRPALAMRLGAFARAFFLDDPVELPACREALGSALCDALIADSVLSHEGERLRSRLRLSPDDGTIVDPAHASDGLTATKLAEHLRPTARRALAFGADLRAPTLTKLASEVVAFDPRPRTQALLRANAALAGTPLRVVEAIEGSFDLVTLDLRFDDPVERVALVRAVSSLADDGTLCAVVESLDRGLLDAMLPPEPLQLLACDLPARPIDEACALRAAALHPELGAAYEHAFDSAMATWSARRVSHVTRGVLVVRRSAPAFRAPRALERAEGRALARSFAACVLAHSGDDDVLGASLALVARGREVDGGLALQPIGADTALVVGPLHAQLFEAIHATASVRSALQTFAERAGAPFERAASDLLPAVREALLSGLLEVSA